MGVVGWPGNVCDVLRSQKCHVWCLSLIFFPVVLLQMFGNWTFGTLVFTVLVFTVTFKVFFSHAQRTDTQSVTGAVRRASSQRAVEVRRGWRPPIPHPLVFLRSNSWRWTLITGRGSTISSSGAPSFSSWSSPCCGAESSGKFRWNVMTVKIFMKKLMEKVNETPSFTPLSSLSSGPSSTTRGCTTSSCRCCPAAQRGSASSCSSLPVCCRTWWRRCCGERCGPRPRSAYRWECAHAYRRLCYVLTWVH